MSQYIDALRQGASEEVHLFDGAAVSEPEAEDGLNEMLATFFATQPATQAWLEIIDELAGQGPVVERPAGRAAQAAAVSPVPSPVTVEGALGLAPRESRGHLQAALGLNADAAAELLERPAAALARRTPAEVRRLAVLTNRPIGSLFADIASSWRASVGYVYAYRPGEPAKTAAESEKADISTLIDWGEALLA